MNQAGGGESVGVAAQMVEVQVLALQMAADEVGIEVHQQVGGQHLVQLVPTGHVEQRQGQGAGFGKQAIVGPGGLE